MLPKPHVLNYRAINRGESPGCVLAGRDGVGASHLLCELTFGFDKVTSYLELRGPLYS